MGKRRIWELDYLRGFAIIMMIFDHLMYDLRNIDSYFGNYYAVNNSVFEWLNNLAELYWGSELRFYGHLFFVSLFLIISGISFTFSKSNLSRSLKMLIVAVLISIITLILQELTGMRMFIIFGVIHMYAFCTFITYLFRRIWDNDIFIMTIATAAIIYGISFEFWSLNYVAGITFENIWGIIIGFNSYGADSFGIIPYVGIIMIGTVIGNQFYKNRVSLLPNVKLSEKNVVLFTGKHSLIIFLTHQLFLFALIFLIGYIFGYTL